MKIAVVSPISVVPAVEGNSRRILSLIRQMRDLGHDVYLILVPTRHALQADPVLHEAEMGLGHFVALPRRHLGNLRHLAKRAVMEIRRRVLSSLDLPGRYYHHLDEYFFASSMGDLARLQEDHGFDMVFVEYVFCSGAFAAFPPGVLKVLDTHDIFADRHLLFGPGATPDSYWYSLPPTRENVGLRRADIVVAIQHEEESLFRARLGDRVPRVVTVSHAPPLSDQITDFGSAAASFIGSAAKPNVDALDYFVSAILPRVQMEVPDFRLFIAGAICNEVPDHPAITKLGRVDSAIEAYAAGPVAINPMRIGTGINIKLLEAMAHGVGTVSTRTGTRGLGAAFSSGVVTVEDENPAAFAEALVRLMRDVSARSALGKAARTAAARWNRRQTDTLAEILATPKEAASGRPPQARP